MSLTPLICPRRRSTRDATGAFHPFASHGRTNSFNFDLLNPVHAHRSPSHGSLRNTGRIVTGALAAARGRTVVKAGLSVARVFVYTSVRKAHRYSAGLDKDRAKVPSRRLVEMESLARQANRVNQ